MRKIMFMVMMLWAGAALATVAVKAVEARQRYPWNGLVDIVVTMEGLADDIAGAEWSFVATNSATKAAVPLTGITQNGSDVGSGTTCTCRFVWNAANDVGAVKIDDVALTVDAKIFGGIQLWENGPYWAECNVGASKPEEYGYYFWWGDTVGYKRNAANDGWVSVKDGAEFSLGSNCPTAGKDISQLLSEGYIDSTGNLVAAHDAATAHLGAPWRMPTSSEIAALIGNCDTAWTTRNGVVGRIVTGRGTFASRSIFFPAAGVGRSGSAFYIGSAGYLWTSTPYSCDHDYFAWGVVFSKNGFYHSAVSKWRIDGCSVRPIRVSAK